ncbi:MAG TPA: alpha/beta fold hydrolase [Anaeromyxobacteraceae bacterium]|nr:alpha/beta fold hydrolase [Anaeromyxobacteraceae bacterium]
MRERAFVFGAHANLFGVLAEPDPSDAMAGSPAVLLANMGVNHHVGSNRLWVDLSRRLARMGFHVLRFDLSGLGDSLQRPGAHGDLERAVLDLREAMDFVSQKGGPQTFVVMGLCSGADSAHAVTVADPRVTGAVYIDGFVWRTPGFWLRYWTSRKLEAARWRRYLRRRAARQRGGPREAGEAREIYQREMPTPEQFRASLGALLGRGTAVLAIYTGGLMDYAYEGQIREMVGELSRHPLFATDYFPRADHLFTDVGEHEKLLVSLCSWMKGRAGRARAEEASA